MKILHTLFPATMMVQLANSFHLFGSLESLGVIDNKKQMFVFLGEQTAQGARGAWRSTGFGEARWIKAGPRRWAESLWCGTPFLPIFERLSTISLPAITPIWQNWRGSLCKYLLSKELGLANPGRSCQRGRFSEDSGKFEKFFFFFWTARVVSVTI